jgi:hypothetical protein
MKIYVEAVEALMKKKGKRCEDGDELITKIHGFLTPLGKRKEGIKKDRMNSVYQKN